MKLNKKSNKGFTIIEVLIVLAIAGLIMSIVFLAVPNLQRNSRNTQYRSDANRLLGAAQEFINNNNSTLPVASASTTANSDAARILALANNKSITAFDVLASATVTAQSPTLSKAFLVSGGVKCPATVGGTSITPTTTGASARSLVLIYAIENADGSVNAQCLNT